MRLIDADALCDRFKRFAEHIGDMEDRPTSDFITELVEMIIAIINKMPTVEAEDDESCQHP